MSQLASKLLGLGNLRNALLQSGLQHLPAVQPTNCYTWSTAEGPFDKVCFTTPGLSMHEDAVTLSRLLRFRATLCVS